MIWTDRRKRSSWEVKSKAGPSFPTWLVQPVSTDEERHAEANKRGSEQ